jgi:hypothetical protein
MITSPINPMRYWKLEEIQSMLNKIEGYENIVIEFQCQQSDGWNKLNWDCKYGIKERLVNGQYNWLLKHVFVIEAKTELDAHNLAWQEAAERLVTDVWRTSIHSFRKQQQEVNKIMTKPKSMNEVIDRYVDNNMKGYDAPRTLTEDDLKIMDEINIMYKPKPKQWLRQAWYWLRAALAFSVMVGVCWFIAEHKIALDVFVWTLGLGLIGGLVYCFKTLMGVVFKDDGFED